MLTQNERTQFYGFGKSVAQKAAWKARKAQKPLDYGGGSGIIRNRNRDRIGSPVDKTSKDINMALDHEYYANTISKKYHINLRGSGQKIKLVYDDTIPSGTYGKTLKSDPTTIRLARDAFISEEELANTIAHELNHCRSFLRGENAPEATAYSAGNAISEYIRGER